MKEFCNGVYEIFFVRYLKCCVVLLSKYELFDNNSYKSDLSELIYDIIYSIYFENK